MLTLAIDTLWLLLAIGSTGVGGRPPLMAAMNDAVALGLFDVLDGKAVAYCPHSKTLNSFSTAVCKS